MNQGRPETMAAPTLPATICAPGLTQQEQATLKTALAFVVLRNRAKKRKIGRLDFCRNVLAPSLPSAPICDTSHVQNMLQIALSAAAPSTEGVIYVHISSTPSSTCASTDTRSMHNARLEGVASHMARHLQHANDRFLWDWMEQCMLNHDIRSVCQIWHCMAETETLSLRFMAGIGQLIQKTEQDEVALQNADEVVVNLLFLLEALVSMRIQKKSSNDVLQELLSSVDQRLTLPIPVEELPAFAVSAKGCNLTAHSKVLLHLALYDLTLQLTNN